MEETAKLIRKELKKLGYTARDVSVQRRPSWKIYVKSKTDKVDKKKVREVTLRAYHANNHHWLCVCCDNTWL